MIMFPGRRYIYKTLPNNVNLKIERLSYFSEFINIFIDIVIENSFFIYQPLRPRMETNVRLWKLYLKL